MAGIGPGKIHSGREGGGRGAGLSQVSSQANNAGLSKGRLNNRLVA